MADQSDNLFGDEELDTVIESTMANSTGSQGYKGGVAGPPTIAGIQESQSRDQYPNPGGASAGATTKSGEGISSTDNDTGSGVSAATDDYGDPAQRSPYLDRSASGDVNWSAEASSFDVGGRLTTPDFDPKGVPSDDIAADQVGGNLTDRGFSGGAGTPAPDQSGGTTGGSGYGEGATGGGALMPTQTDRGSLGVTTDGGTTGFGTTDEDETDSGLTGNNA